MTWYGHAAVLASVGLTVWEGAVDDENKSRITARRRCKTTRKKRNLGPIISGRTDGSVITYISIRPFSSSFTFSLNQYRRTPPTPIVASCLDPIRPSRLGWQHHLFSPPASNIKPWPSSSHATNNCVCRQREPNNEALKRETHP